MIIRSFISSSEKPRPKRLFHVHMLKDTSIIRNYSIEIFLISSYLNTKINIWVLEFLKTVKFKIEGGNKMKKSVLLVLSILMVVASFSIGLVDVFETSKEKKVTSTKWHK